MNTQLRSECKRAMRKETSLHQQVNIEWWENKQLYCWYCEYFSGITKPVTTPYQTVTNLENESNYLHSFQVLREVMTVHTQNLQINSWRLRERNHRCYIKLQSKSAGSVVVSLASTSRYPAVPSNMFCIWAKRHIWYLQS